MAVSKELAPIELAVNVMASKRLAPKRDGLNEIGPQ
jgi:hypothetical protein